MFDWDKDFDDTVAPRRIEAREDRAETRRTLHGAATRWLAPAAVIAGLALAGVLVIDRGEGAVGRAALAGTVAGSLVGLVPGLRADRPPADLIAYGPEQYANFMRSIGRFSDADLLTYADATLRDMDDRADAATPFVLDVLLLTTREIDRRGLSRPVAMLGADHLRAQVRAGRLQL